MDWSAEDIVGITARADRALWDAFLDLMREYWAESFPEDLRIPNWREGYEGWVRESLAAGDRWLWLYRRAGLACALANFFIPPNRPLRGEIAELYVAPAFRRQGLGRFLVRRIRETLRARDIVRVEAGVEIEARRVAFWRAVGFREYRYLMVSDDPPAA
jgi:ribosomal protein S18 acetylase RimI-like enzyme